jgi:3-phenylpropionate/trans-cinnamate dioxygenase ferredoxin subunit
MISEPGSASEGTVLHRIGRLEDFPEGAQKVIDVAGYSMGVYNISGTLFAIRNVCPHALGPICGAEATGTYLPSEPGEYRWGLEGRVLRCQWHGWEFDITTGEALFGTDRRSLSRFPVFIQDGSVFVRCRERRAQVESDQR